MDSHKEIINKILTLLKDGFEPEIKIDVHQGFDGVYKISSFKKIPSFLVETETKGKFKFNFSKIFEGIAYQIHTANFFSYCLYFKLSDEDKIFVNVFGTLEQEDIDVQLCDYFYFVWSSFSGNYRCVFIDGATLEKCIIGKTPLNFTGQDDEYILLEDGCFTKSAKN